MIFPLSFIFTMPRVLVDSKFRTSGTQEDYVVQMWAPAKNIRFIKLLEANLPRSTFPITTGYNDQFEYNNGGGAATATIPPGNYTLAELATALTTLTTTTWAVNALTGRFTVTGMASLGPFVLTPAVHHVLGLPITGITPLPGTFELPFPAVLNWPDYLTMDLKVNGNYGMGLFCQSTAHTYTVPMKDTMFGEYANWSTAERYPQIDNVADRDILEVRITWHPPDENVSGSTTAATNFNNARRFFSFNGVDHQLLLDLIE